MDELSTLSPAAADAAAVSARRAVRTATAVAERVDSGVTRLGAWYGAARDGYADRVLAVRAQLDTLSFTAAAGAELIEGHALLLQVLKTKLAGVDDEIALFRNRLDAAPVDPVATQSDWAELERWQASRARVLAEFDDASAEFATRMFSVLDQVSHRPRRLGEHVDDAARTVVSAGADTAFAAAGWIWDGPGWASTWTQVPGAALDAAEHPVDSLADTVAWDDWSQGRYGAGAATLGMAVVGRGVTGRAGRLGKVLPEGHRWAKYLDADGNPLPQKVDDLFAGVDLGRSEVFASGHTLARHVQVDDEFLQRRLATGEVEDGKSARPPSMASRWADQETAERVITGALRRNAERVENEIDSGLQRIEVVAPAPARAGVIWTKDGQGGYVRVPVGTVRIVLLEAADGSWLVGTAYLEAAS